jgi:hypothetical protein
MDVGDRRQFPFKKGRKFQSYFPSAACMPAVVSIAVRNLFHLEAFVRHYLKKNIYDSLLTL